jgi:hypothetical protein
MKRIAAALCICLLVLGCRGKDEPGIAGPPVADSGTGLDRETSQEKERNGIITRYKGQEKAVVIPAQIGGILVTAIGEEAFMGKGLTSVIIPDSVAFIDKHAFAANNLLSITIPGSVTAIGNNAFFGNRLASVTIPAGVTSIGRDAFALNRDRGVHFTDSVTHGTNLLTTVTIGANVLLGEEDVPSFDNGFDDFYNANGRKAGTYVLSDGQWVMVAQE